MGAFGKTFGLVQLGSNTAPFGYEIGRDSTGAIIRDSSGEIIYFLKE